MSTGAIIIGAVLLLLGLATVIGILCYMGKEGKVEPYMPEDERSTLDPLNPINHGMLPGDVGYSE